MFLLKNIFKTMWFFAYLFSTGSYFINHTSSYKVHSNFCRKSFCPRTFLTTLVHVQSAIKYENEQLNLIKATKTDLMIQGRNNSIQLSLLLL